MSDITNPERLKFEKLFGMSTGYVLNFGDKSFQEFVFTSNEIDIHDNKYTKKGTSKANKLREFIRLENNHKVGKLLYELLNYWKVEWDNAFDEDYIEEYDKELLENRKREQSWYQDCMISANKLMNDIEVIDSDIFEKMAEEENFEVISSNIQNYIKDGKYNEALDRLHTFMIKFSRTQCTKHGVNYEKNEPLNAVFGKYVRFLRENRIVESETTLKILGCSIKILDKFNTDRNDKSLAHDNPLLNHHESLFIFNNICSLVKLVSFIEEM